MSTLVALLERRGRFTVAVPVFERGRDSALPGRVTVTPGEARDGELVLVALTAGRRGARGRVVRRLGRPDVARDTIEALMLHRGLARRFDPAVEREAAAARATLAGRRDLRELATFTIDPLRARDFDDAISAEALTGGAVRVWVHIADVAAHVPEGSLVDREARRRATSVYVPGAVEPMLPAALSNSACSLVPGEDRAAVTVEMDVHEAKVTRVAFHRSLIRSDERLDYDRVDRIFAGAERALDPWAAPLAAARTVGAEFERARRAQGALELTSGEPEFGFDAAGHVTSVQQSVQTESHRLIEHLMIAANEQVAKLLADRGTGALYRVHEQPDPLRVQRLAEQLAALDVATPPIPEPLSPSQAAELVGEMSQLVAQHVRRTGRGRLGLSSLVLRSLKQAYYSPRNIGHAGLRSPRYCHFTSPIRRYPDLVCHRALLHAVGQPVAAPRSGELTELGEWASLRERAALGIERDADDVAACFALAGELRAGGREREWEGEVTGLIGAGAFVAFDGYEGLLPVRRMHGDWWELNETGTILQGSRSGRAIRLGDPIRVTVERVEPARGRVDLALAGAASPKRGPRARSGERRGR